MATSAARRATKASTPHSPLHLAATRVHAHRALAHVVVTDHEDVGHLLQLGGADPLAELLGGLAHVGPEAFGPEPVDDPPGVHLVAVTHGQHPRLHRGQPGRERPGVVLDQHTEEPLDAAEQARGGSSPAGGERCPRRRTPARSARAC